MFRSSIVLCLFLQSLGLIVGISPASAEQAVSMRGKNMSTYGRIIFDFQELPKYEVKSSAGMIVISFDRPLAIQFENISLDLPNYISGARMDPDDKVLRLVTQQKLTTNTTDAGEDLYLDLLPANWKGAPPALPDEVVADLSKRARAAELELRRIGSLTRNEIKVQAGSTATLSRLAFFGGGVLPNRVSSKGDTVELYYEGSFNIDIAKLRSILPRGFSSVTASLEDASLLITLQLDEGLSVRTSVEDGSQYVDIPFKGVGQLNDRPATSGKIQLSALEEGSPDPIQVSQIVAGDSSTLAGLVTSDRSDGPPVLDPVLQIGADDDRFSENFVAQPLVRGADKGVVRFVSSPSEDGIINIQVPEPAAVAAFSRGRDFWIVFETDAAITVEDVLPSALPQLKSIETVRRGGAAYARLELSNDVHPGLQRTGTGWKFFLADKPVSPEKSINFFSLRDDSLRLRAVLQVPEAGQMITLEDTRVGDKIFVIPSRGLSAGLSEEHTFPDFDLLASLQGVALIPKIDDLAVLAAAGEVHVTSAAGLNLSDDRFGAAQDDRDLGQIVMQRSNWMVDVSDNPWTGYRELAYDAAMAAPEKRTLKRLALARFLAANGLYTEADGVFSTAMADDHLLAQIPFNLLENSIYKALSRGFEPAFKTLSGPELSNSPEAWLWRAFIDAERENWASSVQAYQNAGNVIEFYPPALASQLRLSIGEAAIEQGEWALASSLIGPRPELDASGVGGRTAYLRTRLAAAYGQMDAARDGFAALAESPDNFVQMRARLALVQNQLDRKKIAADDAVAELRSITMAWRGDFVEAKALVPLVRLLFDQGEWRDGLVAARRLNILYPEKSGARSLLNEVTTRLSNILETRDQNVLTDVAAISIFSDFKEFLPVGRRGDELIRKFSDRLLDIGLLTQAADLLRYQIDNRYEGLARASIATRLAYIDLLDKKPLSALEVLTTTRVSNMPEDLRRSRLLLEAQARSQLGNTELALDLLEGLKGEDIDLLKADILWHGKKYSRAGELYEGSLQNAWAQQTPLSAEQSKQVLRATIAYALADDDMAIERIKAQYGIKMTRSEDAAPFRLLTLRTGKSPMLARELAGTMTSGKYLDRFMGYYRDRFLANQT